MGRNVDATLSGLVKRQAKVRWMCPVCETNGDVDLTAMLAAKGPDFSLSNRRPPCPLCPGRVRFADWSSMWPVDLDTLTDREDAWWAYQEQERKRLMALGWTLRMGHWIDPDGKASWERKQSPRSVTAQPDRGDLGASKPERP